MNRLRKVFFAFILCATTLTILFTNTASAVMINPIADATNFEQAPNTNFGNYTLDQAGSMGIGYHARSYLQFDLSPFSSIDAAFLGLYHNYTFAPDPGIFVSAYGTSNVWTESDITWNNQPALGLSGGTAFIDFLNPAPHLYSWNVTSLAQSSAGGTFSLALTSDDLGYVGFNSEDAWEFIPYLDVTLSSTKVPEPATLSLLGLGLSGFLFKMRKRIA